MPLAKRRSTLKHSAHAFDLPPPFRPVVLREVGDAFAHACAHGGELGAGTLVFVGRFDLAEFAVVLEPDEPLAAARCAFYAAMVALADALALLRRSIKPKSTNALQLCRAAVTAVRCLNSYCSHCLRLLSFRSLAVLASCRSSEP